MSQALSKKSSLQSYVNLRSRVRAVISAGKLRAQDAVEREKVRTCWEVGKLIHKHILLHKERAGYGKEVIKRLSHDLQISDSNLYSMMEFARTYPIFQAPGKLSWAHYRRLLAINDPTKRKQIADQAARSKWSERELRQEIRKLRIPNSAAFSKEELLIPIKGTLDTYRIVMKASGAGQARANGKTNLQIDLGFSNYLALPQKYRNKFKEGDIVYSGRDAKISPDSTWATRPKYKSESKLVLLQKATKADLSFSPGRVIRNSPGSTRAIESGYTYRVTVLDVTDADTIWLLVELGFGISTKQHVRLRGIDAPEITTRDGQIAKRFIERELKKASSITITSTKSDKYDRYLADVFYVKKGKEFFLNNELLKRGLATRVT